MTATTEVKIQDLGEKAEVLATVLLSITFTKNELHLKNEQNKVKAKTHTTDMLLIEQDSPLSYLLDPNRVSISHMGGVIRNMILRYIDPEHTVGPKWNSQILHSSSTSTAKNLYLWWRQQPKPFRDATEDLAFIVKMKAFGQSEPI